jgi:hypothetical protein
MVKREWILDACLVTTITTIFYIIHIITARVHDPPSGSPVVHDRLHAIDAPLLLDCHLMNPAMTHVRSVRKVPLSNLPMRSPKILIGTDFGKFDSVSTRVTALTAGPMSWPAMTNLFSHPSSFQQPSTNTKGNWVAGSFGKST